MRSRGTKHRRRQDRPEARLSTGMPAAVTCLIAFLLCAAVGYSRYGLGRQGRRANVPIELAVLAAGAVVLAVVVTIIWWRERGSRRR